MRERTHVLVLPGGGYEYLEPDEGEPFVAWLEEAGWRARVVEYPVRSSPEAVVTAVRTGIVEARNAGARRVVLLGFSAGGHAAGLAALRPHTSRLTRPDAVALAYPVVSMSTAAHGGSVAALLGARPARDDLDGASLENLVTRQAPPFFIWHTAEDETVSVTNAYLLAGALAKNRVPHEVHVYPHGPHGLRFGIGAGRASAWTESFAGWLESLFPD